MPFTLPLSIKTLAYRNLAGFLSHGVPNAITLIHLTYFPANGKLYAHNADAGSSVIYESADNGMSWQSVLVGGAVLSIWGLACSNTLLMACDSAGNIYTSANGSLGSWTTIPNGAKSWFHVLYSSTNHAFYLCDAASSRINKTVNGTVIIVGDQVSGVDAWHNAGEYNGLIVAPCVGGHLAVFNDTAKIHELATAAFDAAPLTQCCQIAFNPNTSTWFIADNQRANYAYSTDNGLNWTQPLTSIMGLPMATFYSPTLQGFLGFSGTFSTTYFSTDAISFNYDGTLFSPLVTSGNGPRSIIETPNGIIACGGAATANGAGALRSIPY